jgi:hypothetical protein
MSEFMKVSFLLSKLPDKFQPFDAYRVASTIEDFSDIIDVTVCVSATISPFPTLHFHDKLQYEHEEKSWYSVVMGFADKF